MAKLVFQLDVASGARPTSCEGFDTWPERGGKLVIPLKEYRESSYQTVYFSLVAYFPILIMHILTAFIYILLIFLSLYISNSQGKVENVSVNSLQALCFILEEA